VGDNVLDPFLGSGTTSLAAKNLDRNSIGYEINSEFIDYIKKKLNAYGKNHPNAEYIFIKQGDTDKDFTAAIDDLPYIFRDPHAFDKKIDPKKLQFGSRIDVNSKETTEYRTVKEVISPELLVLDNGLKIRLLGISKDASENGRAIEFIRKKVGRRKVFMKFDETKYDENDNLLCYLYLKDKTFLNAHLIKHGFAKADRKIAYKHKSKFIGLEEGNGQRMDKR
jgi:site-specific DNA-methyltransferase (adenine-specific)